MLPSKAKDQCRSTSAKFTSPLVLARCHCRKLKGSFKRCSLQMAANTSSTLDHKLVTGIYRLNHPHAAAGSWNVGLEDPLVIVSINSSTTTIIAIIENGFSSRRCREAREWQPTLDANPGLATVQPGEAWRVVHPSTFLGTPIQES